MKKWYTLIAGMLAVLALALPAGANAHVQFNNTTLDAEATINPDKCEAHQHCVNMQCNQQQIIAAGETWYLWVGNVDTIDYNLGPRQWGFAVFQGWHWHPMPSAGDTGWGTEQFSEVGWVQGPFIDPSYITIGTRRLAMDGESGFDYAVVLKVVHQSGAWPVNVRHNC